MPLETEDSDKRDLVKTHASMRGCNEITPLRRTDAAINKDSHTCGESEDRQVSEFPESRWYKVD